MDGLDECGSLRHGSSGWDDYEGLLRALKRWVQVDQVGHCQQARERITQIFPDSVRTHVNIPSGSDVEPGDSASNDIWVFLKSRLNVMGVEEAWIAQAVDCLVPHAAGIFIWATTVTDFLRLNPKGQFSAPELEDDPEGLEILYSNIVRTWSQRGRDQGGYFRYGCNDIC